MMSEFGTLQISKMKLGKPKALETRKSHRSEQKRGGIAGVQGSE